MKDEWEHPTSERCWDNYVSLLFRERLDHLLDERGRDVASAGELFTGATADVDAKYTETGGEIGTDPRARQSR